jgi:hypothetical protein
MPLNALLLNAFPIPFNKTQVQRLLLDAPHFLLVPSVDR